MNNIQFLADLAAELDLTDSDDRATFRRLVSDRLAITKVSAMNEWIGAKIRNRNAAIRAVADAYIATVIYAQNT